MSSVGPIAEASVLVVPDTRAFRTVLEEQLLAATKTLVIPVKVAPAAVSTRGITALTVQTTAAATATEGLAAATTASTRAAVEAADGATAEAAAMVKDAEAVTLSAKAHEQLVRGASASILTLGGVRGATLAASGPFLAAAAAVTILAKGVKEANAETEAAARVNKVLGDQLGAGSEKWAQKLANSFGISATVGLKFEGQLANILKVSGFTSQGAAHLSEKLVQLAADMAAFNNVPIETTLKAISLGLVGNSRGLRAFGVELNAAAVNQEALTETGKKNTAELTRQERVQARITLLLQQTTNQMGAAADRAGTLAQQTRILQSNLSNLGADIGRLVIPVLEQIASVANDDAKALKLLTDKTTDTATGARHASIEHKLFGFALKAEHIQLLAMSGPLVAYTVGISAIVNATRSARQETGLLAEVMGLLRGHIQENFSPFFKLQQLADALAGAVARLRAAAAGFKLDLGVTEASNQLDTLNEKLLNAQNNGASLGAQLAIANQAVAKAQHEIAAASKLPGQDQGAKSAGGGQAARRTAEQHLAAALAARKSVTDQIAAQAAAASEETKKKAQAAQDKLDAADQKLLDAISFRRGALDIKAADAAASAGLADDIRVQKAISAELVKDITAVGLRIHNVKLRTETIQALTAALHASHVEEKRLADEQAKAAATRRKLLEDRASERLDLRIQIAEVNKNVKQEIALREARIRADKEKLKSVHGDLVRAEQLRLEIAQDTAAIKELKKAQDANASATASLAFSFLQAQNGFAANLMGNLFPLSAVAGTVGGTHGAISTSTAPSVESARKAREGGTGGTIGLGIGKSGQIGSNRGPTQGQMGVLIDVNRHILRVLQGHSAERKAPEAARQAQHQAARWDFW